MRADFLANLTFHCLLHGSALLKGNMSRSISDSEYRLLAVEIVRQIGNLLIHAGSQNALALAEKWANGEALKREELEAAREKAMKDTSTCAIEISDGRNHAAEAAWLLLTPKIKDWLNEITRCVAKAKAAHTVFKRHGALSPATKDEFEYIRAVELEFLDDRLAKFEAKKPSHEPQSRESN
jgi:hypothetical protein